MKLAEIKLFLCQNKINYTENEPMKRHTTFKIGGNADLFVVPQNTQQLKITIDYCKANNIPLTVIGKGSNLLVSDAGIEGVVICLSALNEITLNKGNKIIAAAGASLFSLCNFAAANSLSGLEFAFGIPGSVGGAVYMNAGAYGGEIENCIVSATAIDKCGNIKVYSKNEMGLGYRTSVFKQKGSIIIEAIFELKPEKTDNIKAAMADYMARRNAKQPLEFPSAGSTFKRPEGHFAGALIEGAQLKGMSVGGAEVSEKHAGFIINKGNASCQDVLNLIEKVQAVVLQKNNIKLEPEVIFIGREV